MDRNLLAAERTVVLIRGVVGVLFGILAVVQPVSTAIALVMLWGFWALFEGIGALAQAFRASAGRPRFDYLLLGLTGLVAAFLAIFSPKLTATSLTWVLGLWLVVRGILEAVATFTHELVTPRWLFLPGAALSVLLGVFFMANPGRAAVGIAVLLGTIAIAWGLVFIASALLPRRAPSSAMTGEGN
ncbi:uncharacterized membrane protein HdeD (DUF308 family) [Kribbella voronezhensis]|uniref:Uncharacterized membrane protein HdeD (DUF308 family) n=1 Tax=Kribbella voronezhensis TaxID=2512212 RepID=A0A4R7SXW8_9ACTN|nr:DUF308 domain-containing protein [Kribbella voronezhensis]TDU83327.1 uncharacterized membrane protein HdeD (DUF308 family) [Kribbella voronezhensis]